MDITVYLPDDLGRWAKDNGVNLSGALRKAVVEEQQRRRVTETTLKGARDHELRVESKDGDAYVAVLRATEIVWDEPNTYVYLTPDERVFVYDNDEQQLYELQNPTDPHYGGGGLRDYLNDDAYIRAMAALGEEAVIEIGRS
jgi:hypothetical protein